MAFFDTLKQNLMTASQVTMDKAKNTATVRPFSAKYFAAPA